jgi:hypothetical protein
MTFHRQIYAFLFEYLAHQDGRVETLRDLYSAGPTINPKLKYSALYQQNWKDVLFRIQTFHRCSLGRCCTNVIRDRCSVLGRCCTNVIPNHCCVSGHSWTNAIPSHCCVSGHSWTNAIPSHCCEKRETDRQGRAHKVFFAHART